jgi:plastocyanin
MGINLRLGLARFYTLAAGMAGALGVAACHGPTTPNYAVPGASNTVIAIGSTACSVIDSAGQSVTQCNLYFTPSPDTVVAGTTLSFQYDDIEHWIVWDTPGAPPDMQPAMNVTLIDGTAQPGVYYYHCRIHPYMYGSVVFIKP